MEKAVALAVNFKNAPAELQAAAVASDANFKLLAKAKSKAAAADSELADLQKKQEELDKVFRKALNAWDPEAASLKGLA